MSYSGGYLVNVGSESRAAARPSAQRIVTLDALTCSLDFDLVADCCRPTYW